MSAEMVKVWVGVYACVFTLWMLLYLVKRFVNSRRDARHQQIRKRIHEMDRIRPMEMDVEEIRSTENWSASTPRIVMEAIPPREIGITGAPSGIDTDRIRSTESRSAPAAHGEVDMDGIRSTGSWRDSVSIGMDMEGIGFPEISRAAAPSEMDMEGINSSEIESDKVVPPGPSLEEIMYSLPLVRYSKTGAHLATTAPVTIELMSQCPICLDEYKEAERIRLLPNCKHAFHSMCIKVWFESHTTCPVCRTDVQVSQNARRQSSLERILSSFRRSGGNQISDSSEIDRQSYHDQQCVTIDITQPPQQPSSTRNTGGPLFPISHLSTGRELRKDQASEAAAPPTSPSTLEGEVIFSSGWGSYLESVWASFFDVQSSGPSPCSSPRVTAVPLTTAYSEEAYHSAGTSFESLSLD